MCCVPSSLTAIIVDDDAIKWSTSAFPSLTMGSFTFYDESYRPCYNEIHSPAIQINFHQAHIVEQTMTIEPNGATRSIGAVGYEQVNRNLTVQLDVIIHDVVAVTAAGGEMGIVCVYSWGVIKYS